MNREDNVPVCENCLYAKVETYDRAADAFLLYKKLKREGADATLISYAVYAFLCGDTPVPVKPDMQQ